MPTGSCLCGKFKYEFTGEPQGKVRVSFPTKAIDNIPPFAHERVSTGTDERVNRQTEQRACRALADIPIGRLQSLHDRGRSMAHYL
jgi:hypothetical protein